MSFDPPIGSIVPKGNTWLIMTDIGWADCVGGSFVATDLPILAKVLHTSRPKFSWLHPFKSRKSQRWWDEGHQFVYGGTERDVNLPDLRGRIK